MQRVLGLLQRQLFLHVRPSAAVLHQSVRATATNTYDAISIQFGHYTAAMILCLLLGTTAATEAPAGDQSSFQHILFQSGNVMGYMYHMMVLCCSTMGV